MEKKSFDELTLLANEYKRKHKNGELSIKFDWEIDLKKIDLKNLNTQLVDDLIETFFEKYTLVILDLDLVVDNKLGGNKVFPKDKLWCKRQSENIARVLHFVENNNKIIPPILNIDEKYWRVIDGNHRIAICRVFYSGQIPFFINKDGIDFIDKSFYD